MWQFCIIKRSILEGKKAKIFNWWKKRINYLISKIRAVSTLGRGRKTVRGYLIERSDNIEHGGDRLTKVSLIYSRAAECPLPGWKLRISLPININS